MKPEIVEVELAGFKGFERRFELADRTVLTGPNGLGKSAVLEAMKWCLTGRVPSGKTKDDAAKFFGPRGGFVKLTDNGGNWIQRSLAVDHESHQVSTKVSSDNGDESHLTFWAVDETVLEIDSFLERSPAKRREFILRLVSSSDLPPLADIRREVGRAYAQRIAGEAASLATLLPDGIGDLSEETAALAAEWAPMWRILSTFHRGTGAEFWLKVTDEAKAGKLAARCAAVKARLAIDELETAAKGAKAAAEHVGALRVASAKAKESAADAESSDSVLREKQKAFSSCEAEVALRDAERVEAAKALEELVDLGEKPVVLGDRRALAGLRKALEERKAACAREVFIDERRVALIDCSVAVLDAEADAESIQREPIGRLVEYVSDSDGELRSLVDEVATAWRVRLETATILLGRRIDQRKEAEDLLDGADPERTQRARYLEVEVEDAQQRLREAEAGQDHERAGQLEALNTWNMGNRQIAIRAERFKTARAAHTALSGRLAELEVELHGIEEVDTARTRKTALKAEYNYQNALKAVGAVELFEKAVTRAADEKVKEKAWRHAERAIQRSRETLVAEVVRPIIGEIGEILRAAGRSEEVYLLLENDRGAPVFDLGWDRGDSRRSLDSLSGGEAVFFVTALALSIAKRSDARKLLLIEADPLDEGNLKMFLGALRAITSPEFDLDACVVATKTPVESCVGWCVWEFLPSGEVGRLRKVPLRKAKGAP